MGNYSCRPDFCEVDVCLRLFAKGLLNAGDADIQDYVPAQNVFTRIFLRVINHYHVERNTHTDAPCSAWT